LMSTYVSQLMQQTGINLSSETSQRDGDDLADIFTANSSTEENPIQEEHREVVVPQPIQLVSPMVQRLQETSVSDRFIGQEMVTSPKETLPVSQVPHIGDRVTPIAKEATPTTVPPVTPELTVVEQVEIPTAIENASFPAPQEEQPRHNLEQPKERTSVASPPEVVETLDVEAVTTQKAADTPLTPQTYLQVVQDWVAGPPTVLEEVREVLVDRPTPSRLPQEDAAKPIILKNHQPSALVLEQVSHSQMQPPTVQQDFVLSIGSIHLTIAAPPPEIAPPPIVPPQATKAPDAEPFRLSRHYLRLR
jgi:hypothetical protein